MFLLNKNGLKYLIDKIKEKFVTKAHLQSKLEGYWKTYFVMGEGEMPTSAPDGSIYIVPTSGDKLSTILFMKGLPIPIKFIENDAFLHSHKINVTISVADWVDRPSQIPEGTFICSYIKDGLRAELGMNPDDVQVAQLIPKTYEDEIKVAKYGIRLDYFKDGVGIGIKCYKSKPIEDVNLEVLALW